jgi:MinD-like ATPase involved in chromosome partitioning or flagellar assembly
MSFPVATAVDPRWEATLVEALAHADAVDVVRRCVDLPDLLAVAAAGLVRAVLLSPDLRRLDRDALTRLAVSGVAVVGVVLPGDQAGAARLRQLGVSPVVHADATGADIAAAVVAAAGAGGRSLLHDYAEPAAAVTTAPHESSEPAPVEDGAGQVVTVWGPTGAPGRTSVALGLAAELAALGHSALLVDSDVYGGVVAQALGLLDESPGLAAACRLANNGVLDLAGLAELAVEARPKLRVLTGIARADRWPELRPTAVDGVLRLARGLADVTVVDCGFALEQDEEVAYDTAAPRRNGATLAAVEAADVVVAVATADPIGLQRFVRGYADLRELRADLSSTVTVVNRLRPHAVGAGDAATEIADALARYAGIRDVRFVPLDVPSFDAALAHGRTLTEAAPASPARLALQSIAAGLVGQRVPHRRRRFAFRGR